MKNILIIEDDLSIAQIEKEYLELAGYHADIETTGIQGLKRALTEPYDLYIIDLMLPGIDGFEIVSQIRLSKEVPILMISARDEEFIKMRAFEVGLDDYLTKPFSPNELVARVKGRLARYDRLIGRALTPDTVLQDHEMFLETLTRRVFRGDSELVLTAREFDLLAFLMGHPEQVFSKTQLFEKIWELDSEGDLSTVTVHIRRLREKIEYDPSNPSRIMTVWGIGYKYVCRK